MAKNEIGYLKLGEIGGPLQEKALKILNQFNKVFRVAADNPEFVKNFNSFPENLKIPGSLSRTIKVASVLKLLDFISSAGVGKLSYISSADA